MEIKIFYIVRSYANPLPAKAAITGYPYVEGAIAANEDQIDAIVNRMESYYIYVTKLTQTIADGRIVDERSDTTKVKGPNLKVKSVVLTPQRPGLKDKQPQLTPREVCNALAICRTNQERLTVAARLIADNEERSQQLNCKNNLHVITDEYRRTLSSNESTIYMPLATTDHDITYLAVSRPDLSPLRARLFSLVLRFVRTMEPELGRMISTIRDLLKNVKL